MFRSRDIPDRENLELMGNLYDVPKKKLAGKFNREGKTLIFTTHYMEGDIKYSSTLFLTFWRYAMDFLKLFCI